MLDRNVVQLEIVPTPNECDSDWKAGSLSQRGLSRSATGALMMTASLRLAKLNTNKSDMIFRFIMILLVPLNLSFYNSFHVILMFYCVVFIIMKLIKKIDPTLFIMII